MLNFEVMATFALQGRAGATQMRVILTHDCFQKVQIQLGDNWHTLSQEEAAPYLAIYEQLRTYNEQGVNFYIHMKAQGPVGRGATMIDGTESWFWLDERRAPDVVWREATIAEAAEMAAYRERIKALKAGDSIMWYEDDAQTGNYGWRTGIYRYPSLGRHSVEDSGPLNMSGPGRLVSHVLPMELALMEGIPGATQQAAA
jgi:hypothetical protein